MKKKRGKNIRVKTRLMFQPLFGKTGVVEIEPSKKRFDLKSNCLGKNYTRKCLKFRIELGSEAIKSA